MFHKKKIAVIISSLLYATGTPLIAHADTDIDVREKSSKRSDDGVVVLDKFVIRAKELPTKVGDAVRETAPSSQTTLSKEQLEKFVGLEGAVTGALRYTPGVHFAGGDGSGVTEGNFTIRGFSQDQVGVTRDGVPVNDPQYGTPHSDFFGEPENYDSINVLYGASSNAAPTLNASGGTIQIKTVAPTEKFGVLLKQSIGSNNLKKSFVRINTGEHDGFSAWVSASRTTADLWTNSGGKIESDRYESNLQYKWGKGNSINAILSSFEMKSNSYYSPTLAAYNSEPYTTGYPAVGYATRGGGTNGVADDVTPGTSAAGQRADFKIQTYGLNGVFSLSDKATLKVNPYYVRVTDGTAAILNFGLNESQINKDLNGDGDKIDKRPVVGTLFPTQYRIGTSASVDLELDERNTLQVGAWHDYIHATHRIQFQESDASGKPATIDGATPITDANGNVVYLANKRNYITTQKIWLQDTWTDLKQWTLTGGLAYQHTRLESEKGNELFSAAIYDRTENYNRLLPSFKASYSVDNSNQVFYSATSSLKVPFVESLYSVPGSASQKPEESLNQEIGWRFGTDKLLINTAVFFNQFKNRQATTTVGGVSSYINAGDLTTKGIELSANGKFAKTYNYFGSFTYTDATQDSDYSDANGTVSTKGKQIFNTPKYLASAGIGYDNEVVYGTFLGRYTGNFYGDLANTQKIDSYTVFDINLGYRFKLAEKSSKLSLNFNNIFDKKYLSGVKSGVVSAASSTPTYFKGQPRSIVASLSIDF